MVSNDHPSEDEEWLNGRIDSWVETYKKSMLTPVVLDLIAEHEPVGIADITDLLAQRTGWRITERGLYRTVRRLQDSEFVASTELSAPRTGAKRKELTLTAYGQAYLAGIVDNLVELPSSRDDVLSASDGVPPDPTDDSR